MILRSSFLEYHPLLEEAWTSAVFGSNFLETNKVGYFRERSQFSFLKHTWSLSAEIQFYLVVPLPFYTFELLDKKHEALKFGLISVIGAGSFATQSFLNGDLARMLLFSRMWQFMAGFATFHLHESGLLNMENLFDIFGALETNEEIDEKQEEVGIFRQSY